MVETGKTPESHLDPEWQKTIKKGIQEALDNFKLFGVVNVSPLSISGGEDERNFLDLSKEEQDFTRGVLFKEIGFDPQNPENVTSHIMQAPEGAEWQGEASVMVYKTARSDEGMFLHEITYPKGETDYIVAPEDFRL